MTKKIEATAAVTTEATEAVVTYDVNAMLTELKSKSAVIRKLASDGMACKTIYKLLTEANWTNNAGTNPIRYQHVRNVLVTPVKKGA